MLYLAISARPAYYTVRVVPSQCVRTLISPLSHLSRKRSLSSFVACSLEKVITGSFKFTRSSCFAQILFFNCCNFRDSNFVSQSQNHYEGSYIQGQCCHSDAFGGFCCCMEYRR